MAKSEEKIKKLSRKAGPRNLRENSRRLHGLINLPLLSSHA